MSDLLAECDWRDGTLFLVLPEDPERIGVRLFPSRYAPSRMYVPEAEIVLTKAENAKLRELCARMFKDFVSCDCELRARAGRTFMAFTRYALELRELGIEVDE